MFDDCEFVDVGFSGPRFTWSNKREGQTRISERLDRACCTRTWREAIPALSVQVQLTKEEGLKSNFNESRVLDVLLSAASVSFS